MMQMTDMPIAMMLGMGLIWLLVIIFLLLGIAAFIKYRHSSFRTMENHYVMAQSRLAGRALALAIGVP